MVGDNVLDAVNLFCITFTTNEQSVSTILRKTDTFLYNLNHYALVLVVETILLQILLTTSFNMTQNRKRILQQRDKYCIVYRYRQAHMACISVELQRHKCKRYDIEGHNFLWIEYCY